MTFKKFFSATSLSGKRRIIYAFASVFTPITLIVSVILLKLAYFYRTPEPSIIFILSITLVIWRLLVRRFRGKFAAKDWIIGIGTLAGIPLLVYIIENPDFAKRFVRESKTMPVGRFSSKIMIFFTSPIRKGPLGRCTQMEDSHRGMHIFKFSRAYSRIECFLWSFF